MSPSVRYEVDLRDEHVVVRISGRLTGATAPEVRGILLKCLAEQPAGLIAELSGLTAEDPGALAVFTAVARQAAMWPGTPLLLCAPRPATAALLGSGRVGSPPLFPDVAAALATRDGRVRMPSISDELLPVTGAARRGRDLVTEACARWDLPELLGPAGIVVSELVTNVVVHAHTIMKLRLSVRRRYLHIAVHDGSTQPPRQAPMPALNAAGGRGLALIDAIAQHW